MRRATPFLVRTLGQPEISKPRMERVPRRIRALQTPSSFILAILRSVQHGMQKSIALRFSALCPALRTIFFPFLRIRSSHRPFRGCQTALGLLGAAVRLRLATRAAASEVCRLGGRAPIERHLPGASHASHPSDSRRAGRCPQTVLGCPLPPRTNACVI
ncbi:hypothetical protein PENSPDRAFT_278154 [Peniophora sp. CONT]|nr:hypothetical protein PENSPDRAFT_278154 [Peniophora sp. CONT]